MQAAIATQRVIITGQEKGNKSTVHETARLPKSGVKVFFRGKGNKLIIGKDCDIRSLEVEFLGDNNTLVIDRGARIKAKMTFKGDEGEIRIGHHVEFVEATLQAEYGTSIKVGPWGIYSRGLIIRTGDSHSVIDIATLKRVNFPKSIEIAERVWAGYDVSIMKGVKVEPDTIIGAAAVVNRSPGEGQCILAGTPAKVVRRGVFWEKRSLGQDVPDSYWTDCLRVRGLEDPRLAAPAPVTVSDPVAKSPMPEPAPESAPSGAAPKAAPAAVPTRPVPSPASNSPASVTKMPIGTVLLWVAVVIAIGLHFV